MSTDSLQATEDYSAARSTHPRVSLRDMEAKIAEKHFFTAGQAIQPGAAGATPVHPLDLLTICILVMANGFTVIGKSAPASPENFDAEKGRAFAYEDAIRQLWPLEGYALREKLAAGAA